MRGVLQPGLRPAPSPRYLVVADSEPLADWRGALLCALAPVRAVAGEECGDGKNEQHQDPQGQVPEELAGHGSMRSQPTHKMGVCRVTALFRLTAGMTVPIEDVDQRLLWLLRAAGDEWGPRGVAKAAAQLAGVSWETGEVMRSEDRIKEPSAPSEELGPADPVTLRSRRAGMRFA